MLCKVVNKDLDRFSIRREIGTLKSYVVISVLDDKKIFQYQVEMIRNNCFPNILNMNSSQNDNKINFYYDTTSKTVLSDLLVRDYLKKDEIIEMLKAIVIVFLRAKNYFLYESNFVIDKDFIYIDPNTKEVYLVYLPVSIENDIVSKLKEFIIDVIEKNIVPEDSGNDVYIGELLNLAKGESFNLLEIYKLLNWRKENYLVEESVSVKLDNEVLGKAEAKAVSKNEQIVIPKQNKIRAFNKSEKKNEDSVDTKKKRYLFLNKIFSKG